MYSDIVHCTVYSVHCIKDVIHHHVIDRTLYNAQCTVYSVHCTLYNVQCTMYSIQYIPFTVHYTIYSIQFTLYNVRYKRSFAMVKDVVFPQILFINFPRPFA